MTQRLQYQAWAEPPPEATGAPEAVHPDAWARQLSEPRRSHAPRLPGHWSGVLEPTLFTAPPELSWRGFQPDRAPTHQPRLPGWFSTPNLEPSLYTAPPELSWKGFQPDTAPTHRPRLPGHWSGVLEPSLFEAPPALSWWSPASEPVRKHPSRLAGYPAFSVDTVTPADTVFDPTTVWWWSPASEPVRSRPPLRQSSWWAGVLERTLFEAPPELSWLASYPDFARRHAPRQQGLFAAMFPTSLYPSGAGDVFRSRVFASPIIRVNRGGLAR